MPTFRNWKTESGYGVVANLPNAPHPFTYQLKPRAVEFYKELGYENHSKIDGRLVWPLRKLGDLYIGGKEESSDDEIKELPTLGDLDKFSFTDTEKRALAQYVRDHPLSTKTIRDNIKKQLFDNEFDFSKKITGAQNTIKREESDKDSHSLPVDVINHIDDWVNWGMMKMNSSGPSDRNECLKSIAEISGAVESVRDFADHSTSVWLFSQTKGIPSYHFSLEENTLSNWTCDDYRFDDRDTDFSVGFQLNHQLLREENEIFSHMFDIVDGYIANWEVHSKYDDEINVKKLTPVEWHNVIHDQSRILRIIRDFFNGFPEYELANSHEL